MDIKRSFSKYDRRKLQLETADKYIKRIMPEAVYMERLESYSVIWCYNREYENGEELQFNEMAVEGKVYVATSTNKYEELVKYFDFEDKKREPTLFDFIEDDYFGVSEHEAEYR